MFYSPLKISTLKHLMATLIITTFLFESEKSRAQSIDWIMKGNPFLNAVNSVAFSSDGQKVISGTNCHPASIRIFDKSDGTIEWDFTIGGNYMCIMGATFSSNGNYIAAVEEFGNIFIFDNSGPTPVITDTLSTGTSYAFSVAIAPDSDRLAVGCSQGKLKIYSLPGANLLYEITAHAGWVTSCTFSLDGNKIVTGGSDGKVKIWNHSGTLLFTCSGHNGHVTSVKVTPDNNFVVSSSKDNKIKIWNITTGELVKTLSGHTEDVNAIDISPDGAWIVSASSDSTCRIWNLHTGSWVTTFGIPDSGAVNAVAWSPDGDKIVTGNVRSDVTLWDISLTLNDKNYLSSSLRIFPNPVNDFLEIRTSVDLEDGSLLMFDPLGKIKKIQNGLKGHDFLIDVSILESGHYYLVLVNSSKELLSGHILKN